MSDRRPRDAVAGASAGRLDAPGRAVEGGTNRRSRSSAARDSQLLADVLGRVQEPLVVTTADGHVLCASNGAEMLLAGGASLRGELLATFVSAESRAAFTSLLAAGDEAAAAAVRLAPLKRKPVDVVLSVVRRDGHAVWRIDEPVAGDAVPGIVELVESLSDAVVAVDAAGAVTLANGPARRLLGVALGEPLPDRWNGFELQAFARSLFVPAALHAEAHVPLAGGRSYSLTGLPSRRQNFGVVLVAETTHRALKERLEQEFVVNAAHELQTPLTAIVGLVDVLTGDVEVDDQTRSRFNEHLQRETRRIVRLVDALLLLARVGAVDRLERERVEVAPLLRRVAQELDAAPGVEIRVDAPSGLVVDTHVGLLEAVVTNVAQNAARHTRAGEVVLRAQQRRGAVVVGVHDTGTGMDAITRARATDRFFKAGDGAAGFGLGLSIAAQAADALGGTLEIDSSRGVGTTIRLVLPDGSE